MSKILRAALACAALTLAACGGSTPTQHSTSSGSTSTTGHVATSTTGHTTSGTTSASTTGSGSTSSGSGSTGASSGSGSTGGTTTAGTTTTTSGSTTTTTSGSTTTTTSGSTTTTTSGTTTSGTSTTTTTSGTTTTGSGSTGTTVTTGSGSTGTTSAGTTTTTTSGGTTATTGSGSTGSTTTTTTTTSGGTTTSGTTTTTTTTTGGGTTTSGTTTTTTTTGGGTTTSGTTTTSGGTTGTVLPGTGLFFAEYIEGSSNNKALELFNNTGAPVDLSLFQIKELAFSATGTTPTSATTALTGTLAAGATYVVCNSQINASYTSLCQGHLAAGAMQFNGNDTLELLRLSDGAIIDAFGDGKNPGGTGWSAGGVSTQDHTLRRKCAVREGVTALPTSFDPSAEWNVFPVDTFCDLGSWCSATGDCGRTNAWAAGTTDADCGVQHFACPAGERCELDGDGANSFYGCACSFSDGGSDSDTCQTNGQTGGTGASVCDVTLRYCREPGAMDPANAVGTGCASGLSAVGSYYPDGGLAGASCVEDCTSSGTCSATYTSCQGPFLTADGGSMKGCYWNLCGPGYTADSYFGTCNADGSSATSGTCYPVESQGSLVGVCFRNGNVATGGACTGEMTTVDPTQTCAAGSLCVGTGEAFGGDVIQGTCATACDAATGAGCATGQTCYAYYGTTSGTGFCVANADAGGGDVSGFCGEAYLACHYGEACQQFGGGSSGVPTYYACTCSTAGGTDSCTTNDYLGGAGNVVCDSTTQACRRPRDYDLAFTNATTVAGACDVNYELVSFGTFPDAGPALGCLQDCDTSACGTTWTTCVAGALTVSTADGGTVPMAACLQNGCGNFPDGGLDGSQSWAACDVSGFGDGVCQPLPTTGGYTGVCFKTGAAGLGGHCGDTVDPAQNCGADAICLTTGYGSGYLPDGGAAPNALCFESCNASGAPANGCSAGGSCVAYTTDPSGAAEQAGYCQ